MTAWAATKVATKQIDSVGAWEAITQASFIVQLVLIILLGLSVWCWGIFFFKRKVIKITDQANADFLVLFFNADSFDEIQEQVSHHNESSMAKIFVSGFSELKKMKEVGLVGENNKNNFSGMDNLERAMDRELADQVALLENQLGILSTTGSTGPFIGLFGTVWGIMGAFQKIGVTGVASLAVVAPGIAEALIATAIGLAAAIPATMMYNHFVAGLRKEEKDLNNFISDFLNLTKRNFF